MRGKPAKPREIKADPKHGSVLLAKFINYIMQRGKKTVAQGIVYDALQAAETLGKRGGLIIFEEAIRNLSPQVEVRTRRVGGANYQVPMPVRGERQNALAFRWLIGAARGKKGQSMAKKLATVVYESSQGTGDAIKKRDDVHRMAEANRAFAHFARFSR